MRRILHILITVVAFVFWGIGNALYAVSFMLGKAADNILPYSVYGNCWTYAVPKFLKRGGYLLIRPADGQKFLGFLPLPHVIWVEELSKKTILHQFVPIDRKSSRLLPWYTIYYRGKVKNVESEHNAKDEEL